MPEPTAGSREEVARIRRVADQLCSAHSSLSERYSRRATLLDLTILLLSAWLTSLAFVDPRLSSALIPFGLDATLWIGILGLGVFGLTLVQLKVDWKGKSEAHKKSFVMYAEVKREGGYLLASSEEISPREFQRLAARYDMASDVGTGVPESQFLRLKQHHKVKVEISKLLDTKPGANVLLTRLKLFVRDNCPCRRP
jgi:hypothetical protein